MTQLSQVYACLATHDPNHVVDALNAGNVIEWVWTGEGFCAVERVFLRMPNLDLRPFAYPVPAEVHAFSDLFCACGVQKNCGTAQLVKVLL